MTRSRSLRVAWTKRISPVPHERWPNGYSRLPIGQLSLTVVVCLHNKTTGRNSEMKKLMLAAALTLAVTTAQAQYIGTGSNQNSHGVQGHVTNSGTYVAPHVATNPNNTQRDNYSATGNVNPYTGAVGTRNPRY